MGDVMALPMEGACYDAVICLAVLEHVPRPWKAVEETCRVLKSGGKLFCYVPFLSPYHAMEGYYGDYFRFTEDGIRALCEGFSRVEVQAVRGPVETLTHLLPGKLGASWVRRLGRRVDGIRKASGKQVSGYFFVATK
jgi:ubiquinone/menaquinone biosynthesis C-methylase UbiE